MNEKTWFKMALKELFKTPIGEQGSIVWPQPLEKAAEDFERWPLIGQWDRKGRSEWISDRR